MSKTGICEGGEVVIQPDYQQSGFVSKNWSRIGHEPVRNNADRGTTRGNISDHERVLSITIDVI